MDAFCEAMIGIRAEIDKVGAGSGLSTTIRCAAHRTPRSACWRLIGTTRIRGNRPPTRSAPHSDPRFGPRYVASTAPTGIATWSAHARR